MQDTTVLEDKLVEMQPAILATGGGMRGYLKPEDIEDAVQDANLKTLEKIRSNTVDENLHGLLYTITRRQGCKRINQQKRQAQVMKDYACEMAVLQHDTDDPAVLVAEREDFAMQADRLWWAFCQLEDLERMATGLRYFAGYSYQAIAEEMGFDDEEAVNTCLRRARRQMRQLLEGGAA